MEIIGDIFNIQSFSVSDGPGIRTTVFFSGCNLHCAWCHNPESWDKRPQLNFDPEKCIGCGNCFRVCPAEAHVITNGVHHLLRDCCDRCGRCADHCYAGAIKRIGRSISVQTLFDAIKADQAYFQNSGGGVTFSGGECMIQPDFLAAILRMCADEGIHTAVDTAGHVPFTHFTRILAHTDLFLYDIKASDDKVHRALTGVDSALIWENLARLLAAGADVIVRVPCVIGANWDEMPAIARRLAELPIKHIELLPYHKLGEAKPVLLGFSGQQFGIPTNDQMSEVAALFDKPNRSVSYIR